MTSRRKAARRALRWERYITRTSRSSVRGFDYPFGLSIKVTPGCFGRRQIMRYRGRTWYLIQQIGEDPRQW